jgi:hypothetical protein
MCFERCTLFYSMKSAMIALSVAICLSCYRPVLLVAFKHSKAFCMLATERKTVGSEYVVGRVACLTSDDWCAVWGSGSGVGSSDNANRNIFHAGSVSMTRQEDMREKDPGNRTKSRCLSFLYCVRFASHFIGGWPDGHKYGTPFSTVNSEIKDSNSVGAEHNFCCVGRLPSE